MADRDRAGRMVLTETCFAADPRYPDWPCAQAKVPGVPVG